MDCIVLSAAWHCSSFAHSVTGPTSADSTVVSHCPAQNSLVEKQREAVSVAEEQSWESGLEIINKEIGEIFKCPLENGF